MPYKLRASRTSAKAKQDDIKKEADTTTGSENKKVATTESWIKQELDPQRLALFPDLLVDALSSGGVQLIRCGHPRTGSPSLFALVKNKPARLFELVFHSTTEGFCSFLIDQSVEKDGRLITATPFDARFLVLDKLRKVNKFVEISDYFEGDMIQIVDGLKLDAIADTKEVCGRQLAKYNEERVLKWLEAKVRRLAKVLQDKEIPCGAVARSKLLKKEKDENDIRSYEDYICSTVEIVREYIADALGDLLEKRLGIDRKRSLKERDIDASDHTSPNPKRKKTDQEPAEDYTKQTSVINETKATPKLTAAQKKLASCDKTGMKSIMSFFGRKN
ncbi:ribonuclease H2 subunit B-like [Varroa jacobsoni]|uniref:ribonuclease H2 subunit B-like n=1 Tax=Varroa jacobsoni TaxID=62625 RepID=UPI000BF9F94D|nr:ribonuclease H2 subunit B-like [Varroa jacobsoni]